MLNQFTMLENTSLFADAYGNFYGIFMTSFK